jgi:hypothetical protein
MNEDVNEMIGTAAGKVWSYLSVHGQASASKLCEGAKLDKNEVQRAIGWLAREGKIAVERRGKNEFFSLVF